MLPKFIWSIEMVVVQKMPEWMLWGQCLKESLSCGWLLWDSFFFFFFASLTRNLDNIFVAWSMSAFIGIVADKAPLIFPAFHIVFILLRILDFFPVYFKEFFWSGWLAHTSADKIIHKCEPESWMGSYI